MTTHPAWWAGEKTADGVLGGRRSAALAPPPPSEQPPFAALARQPSAVPGEDRHAPDTGDDRGADAAGFVTFPLGNAAESPCAARSLTRITLEGWGLEELADDAVVVVSELVTNALRYGLPPEEERRPLPPATTGQPFLLSLVHYGGSVLCAVFDPGAGVPVVREPDFLRESGRGLHVLRSLSESWGWTTPDRHGKAVWALLRSGREPEAEAGAERDPVAGSPLGPPDAEWEPLTRLLLLLELLSGPSWLKALGSSSQGPHGGGERAG